MMHLQGSGVVEFENFLKIGLGNAVKNEDTFTLLSHYIYFVCKNKLNLFFPSILDGFLLLNVTLNLHSILY